MRRPRGVSASALLVLCVAASPLAARDDQIFMLGNLVDGDLSAQIADIDKLVMVMKGGRIHDPARIEQALGIAPRDRT